MPSKPNVSQLVETARPVVTRLAEDEDMTQTEIAKLVDKSRSHVANFQRRVDYPTLPGVIKNFSV